VEGFAGAGAAAGAVAAAGTASAVAATGAAGAVGTAVEDTRCSSTAGLTSDQSVDLFALHAAVSIFPLQTLPVFCFYALYVYLRSLIDVGL
jgi:hypothetical protein